MSPFSEATIAFLKRSARSARSFSRRELRVYLRRHFAPILESHIAWEEQLARTVEQEEIPLGGIGLLEVGGLVFGTAQIKTPWKDWAAVRRPEGAYVLVGRNSSTYSRLYIDAKARLFRQLGSLWTPLAESPVIYIERLAAKDGTAPFAIELRGRAGAAVAEQLAVPRLEPASDALCSVFSDARLCILDGQWDRPLAEAATVFIRDAAALAPLFQVLSALGLSLYVEPTGEAKETEASDALPRGAVEAGSAEARLARPYAAPTDLCAGEVALDGPAIVQIVRDEKGEAVERGVFAMDGVVLSRRMRASSYLAGRVSERALAYLDADRFVRDPRWTCSAASLSALLRDRGLPVFPAALAFEQWLGGFIHGRSHSASRYGALQMLRQQDEMGIVGGSDVYYPGGLIVDGAWPHVRFGDIQLVPVGRSMETGLYVGEDGLVYAHSELLDIVGPFAAGPRELVEGFAARSLLFSMRLQSVRIAADAGEIVGKALGLSLDPHASDSVNSYWTAKDVVVEAFHPPFARPPETRVAANSIEPLADAVRAVFASAPDAKVSATDGRVFDQLHAIDPRVERSS